MSEIKVGDIVWIRQVVAEPEWVDCIGVCDSDDCPEWEVRSSANYIPDVPGLAEIAALIAEVGAENLRASIGYGASLIRDAFDIQHRDAVVRPVNRSSQALDHLLALAAALEMK